MIKPKLHLGALFLCGGAVILGAAPSAMADTVLAFLDNDGTTRTIAVSGHLVRVDEQGGEDGDEYTIYNARTRVFLEVLPDDRSYRRLSPDRSEGDEGQGSQSGDSQKGLSGAWTGKSMTVAGAACRWADLSYQGMFLASMCLASEEDLGLTAEEAAAINVATSSNRTTPINLVRMGLKGLPVASRNADGETTALQSLSHARVPQARFEVPAEYEEMP